MRKLALSFALVSALFGSRGAHAEPGSVVLKDDTNLLGDIREVIPGKSLTIALPSGEVRTIPWSLVAGVILSGSTPAASGSTSVKAAVSPPAAAAPAPPTPAPMTEITTKDAAPVHAVTADSYPAPIPGRLVLGARLAAIVPSGSAFAAASSNGAGRTVDMTEVVAGGWAIQIDAGVRLAKNWMFYGLWEHARLGKGSSFPKAEEPISNAVGGGFQADTNPTGRLGAVFDLAMAYRWIGISAGNDKMVVSGFEPVRLGVGFSFTASQTTRFRLMAQSAVGIFSRLDLPEGCVNGTGDCDTIPDDRRAVHAFHTISFGGTFDL